MTIEDIESQREAVKHPELNELRKLKNTLFNSYTEIEYQLNSAISHIANLKLNGKYVEKELPTILTMRSLANLANVVEDLRKASNTYEDKFNKLYDTIHRPASEDEVRIADDLNPEYDRLYDETRAEIEALAKVELQPEPAVKESLQDIIDKHIYQPQQEEVTLARGSVLPPPPHPENSISRLLGIDSPLFEIFAPSIMVPGGRGFITIGSEGFPWHGNVDTETKGAVEKASLPTGFYGELNSGNVSFPKTVLIRLEKSILHWNFSLDPNGLQVYMVGISDSNMEDLRWFTLNNLTATFTRRLVVELENFIQKHRPTN